VAALRRLVNLAGGVQEAREVTASADALEEEDEAT